MLRLRDMGLRSKTLITACQDAGVYMTKERASRIINGQTRIKPDEMEVIAKVLNRSVDDLYRDIGSCIFTIGSPLECEYWDWEKWCNKKIGLNRRERIYMYQFKFMRRS